MAGVPQLQKQFVDYKASLFHEGVLDEQFDRLHQLQDDSNPNFLVEVVSLYFEDTEKILNELANILNQQSVDTVDFKKVDSKVHRLKGSSSYTGTQRIQRVCIGFCNCGEERNLEGCLTCLQLVKHEYAIVKIKLENLFKLQQQILAAGGIVPK